MEQIYNKCVSLGHWCQTKAALNEYFFPTESNIKTQPKFSSLFDWMYVHSYSKLANALDNDLVDLFDYNNFKLDKQKSYHNIKYKMTWNHLYDKKQNNDDKGIDDISNIKSKYDYLITNFKNLKNFSTLYVISFPYEWGISLHDLISVSESLLRYRENNCNFTILYLTINIKKYLESDLKKLREKKILVYEMKNLGKKYNDYDINIWRETLDKFKFDLKF